jgi:hypothetical protein
MATPDSCCSPCPTLPPVNVPGMEGPAGANGTNGTNGIDSFTFTTANFTIPAADGATQVVVSVAVGTWMAAGQYVAIPGLLAGAVGIFQVVSSTSVTATLVYPTFTTNTHTGDVILSGAKVSPAGKEGGIVVPVSIANGGTNATTKASAQTNLGVGQNAIISTASGLTQAITASAVQVGAIDIQITATGEYLYLAHVSVDWIGVTFASSRVVTIIIRNITQGITLATALRDTQVLTTATFPTIDYHLPFVIDATAAVNDHIQLQISVAVINSAGTFEVTAGSLCAVPLRLT